MATCPNKSLPEWKELERLHPDTCYYLWDKYEGYVPQEYYKETSTIKQGVSELFESNPKLANAVYEALGFSKDFDKNTPIGNLLNFLQKYGFEINESENLIIDLANKTINLKTSDISQVAKALASPLSEMLSYSDYFYNIEKEIRDTKRFKDRLVELEREHKGSTKRNLKRIATKEIFKDLLESGFSEKLAKELNISKSLLEKIKDFITNIINSLKDADFGRLKSQIDKIVESTFKGDDFIRLTKKEGYRQVNFQEAFEENSIAKDIMTKIGTHPSIILTGSIAYSTQGTVYRKIETVVHDLDFVNNNLSDEEIEKLVKDNYPDAIKAYSFFDKYNVDTYLIPEKGLKIKDIKRRETGKIISYNIVDNNNNIVGTYRLQFEISGTGKTINEVEIKTGKEAMLVDFFSNDKSIRKQIKYNFKGSDGKTHIVNLSEFTSPFEAKLQYSRFKDIWDYNRFIPNRITPEQKQKAQQKFQEYIDATGRQDIEGFKKFVNKSKSNEFYQRSNEINYQLKAVGILLSDKAKQVFDKGEKAKWSLDKILTELAIPKEQKQLLLDLGIKDREQLALELVSKYGYTVEINTATGNTNFGNRDFDINSDLEDYNRDIKGRKNTPTQYYSNLSAPGGTNYTENEISTPLITPSIKGHAQFSTDKGIGWFRSDEQADVNDIKNKIEAEKEFKRIAEQEGYADTTLLNQINKQSKGSKTRRILEIQSDLFQKSRDNHLLIPFDKDLIKDTFIISDIDYYIENQDYIERFKVNNNIYLKIDGSFVKNDEYIKKEEFKNAFEIYYNNIQEKNKTNTKSSINSSENQFLQLLNKDDNWVRFFIKSIIQDSAKKGYEKVLFPKGDTLIKIESAGNYNSIESAKNANEENLVNTALFYEIKVGNILEKQFGKDNVKTITDEYGNQWREITIQQDRDLANIFLQEPKAIPLEGNEALYKDYNLLTEDGKIKDVSGVKNVAKWVATLNLSPYYSFKLRNTTGGPKILIFPKTGFLQNTQTSESPNEKLDSIVKQFLDKIGVSLETLSDGDFIAKAKILDKIIQVVQGRADVSTLPEEASHFFEQLLDKNSTLYKQMWDSIESQPIYIDIYNEYSAVYTDNEGNPDVDKIKKEAIAKLITQHLVALYKGGKLNRPSDNWFERAWNVIQAVIRKALKSLGISGLTSYINAVENNISYSTAAKRIATGNLKDLSFDNADGNDFNQLNNSNTTQNDLVTAYVNSQTRFTLVNEKVGDETIHQYIIDKETSTEKTVKVTPSTVAGESRRGKNRFNKIADDKRKLWEKFQNEGTKVHGFIQDFIINKFSSNPVLTTELYNNLSAKDQLLYTSITSEINSIIKQIQDENPGSVFLPEIKLYDPSFRWRDSNNKTHKGIAGSIDLLVIHPDGTASIYDWKTVNKKGGELSPLKYAEYSHQVALYKRMLLNGNYVMGIPKVRGVKKTRLIPIEIVRDIGTGDISKLKVSFQTPVSGESTGNVKLDQRIENIYKRFTTLVEKKMPADPVKRAVYEERLNNIKDMLINLQLKKSYNNILEQAHDDLGVTIDSLSNPNITIKELHDALEVTEMYSDILEFADRSAMNSVLREEFEDITGLAIEYKGIILNKIQELLEQSASEFGIDNLLEVQKGLGWVGQNFTSISEMNHPIVQMFYEQVKEQIFNTEKESTTLRKEIELQIGLLSDWASKNNMSLQEAYNKLLDKNKGILIDEYSKEFREQRANAFKTMDEGWLMTNLEIDTVKAEAWLTKFKDGISNRVFSRNKQKNNTIIADKIEAERRRIYAYISSPFIRVKDSVKDSWYSKEYKYILANKPLNDFYIFFTNTTKELSKELPNFGYNKRFIPNIASNFFESFKSTSSMMSYIRNQVSINPALKQDIGTPNYDTGVHGGQVPVYFTNPVSADKKSYDLGRILAYFGEMAYNFKNMTEIEDSSVAALDLLKQQQAIEVSRLTGKPVINKLTQNVETSVKANKNWVDVYEDFMGYFLYNIRTKNPSKFTQIVDSINKYTAFNLLGLSVFPALAASAANVLGAQVQASRNTYYGFKEEAEAMWALSGGSAFDSEQRRISYGFLEMFNPQIDQREKAKDRKLSANTLTKYGTNEHMFILLRTPDQISQAITFIALLKSSTFDKNGNIIPISKYIRELRPSNYYYLTNEEKEAVDKSIEEEKKNIKSIYSYGKIVDNKFTVEGHNISDKQIIAFRQYSRQVTKAIIGNMDPNDPSAYKLNVYTRALMLFRNWMPRAVQERYGSLSYNKEMDKWTWGRYMTAFNFTKRFWSNVFNSITKDANKLKWGMLIGPERAALIEYEKLIAESPEMSDKISVNEFVDLYKSNMRATYAGLIASVGLLLLVFFAGRMFDDDDELQPGEKIALKALKRAYSEMVMFMNPLEAINILKSPTASIMPLVTLTKAIQHTGNQFLGYAVGDYELQQNARPVKYWMGFNPFVNVEKFYRILDENYQELIEDSKTSDETTE